MITAQRCVMPSSERPRLELADECVVFALCDQIYAVAADRLLTCLSLPRLTALDDTPPYLVGAFDLRGALAPVVSPAVLSGSSLQPASKGDLLVVVDVASDPLALHADTVLGIEPLCKQPWERSLGSSNGTPQISLSGGRARLIDPSLIKLVAETTGWTDQSADERLRRFERNLDAAALALLESRAERYRGLGRVGSDHRGWRQINA